LQQFPGQVEEQREYNQVELRRGGQRAEAAGDGKFHQELLAMVSPPPRSTATMPLTVPMAGWAIGGVDCDDRRLLCEEACGRDAPQAVLASTAPAAKRFVAIEAPCHAVGSQRKRRPDA